MPIQIRRDKTRMVSRSLVLCRLLHGKQARRYDNQPYWWHPVRVAKMIERCGDFNPYTISTALLHDVLEDTTCSEADLTMLMGKDITRMVLWLTDYPNKDLNRKARKEQSRARLAACSSQIQTIKLSDLYDNCKSIVKHDPGFAKVFMKEYEQLFDVLDKGNDQLRRLCDKQLNDYFTLPAYNSEVLKIERETNDENQ